MRACAWVLMISGLVGAWRPALAEGRRSSAWKSARTAFGGFFTAARQRLEGNRPARFLGKAHVSPQEAPPTDLGWDELSNPRVSSSSPNLQPSEPIYIKTNNLRRLNRRFSLSKLRRRPMRVVISAMSRTGKSSVFAALRQGRHFTVRLEGGHERQSPEEIYKQIAVAAGEADLSPNEKRKLEAAAESIKRQPDMAGALKTLVSALPKRQVLLLWDEAQGHTEDSVSRFTSPQRDGIIVHLARIPDKNFHMVLSGTHLSRQEARRARASQRGLRKADPSLRGLTVFSMSPESKRTVNKLLDRVSTRTGVRFSEGAREEIYRRSQGWLSDVNQLLIGLADTPSYERKGNVVRRSNVLSTAYDLSVMGVANGKLLGDYGDVEQQLNLLGVP